MIVLRSGSSTDVGRVRTSNQDVALEEPDLFAVADGMGGHVGGEVAARVAVDTLRDAFQRDATVEGLRRAVAEANRAVWGQAQEETGLRGMGTTLTATALVRLPDGSQVIALANVGDSRAYVHSNREVVRVTADHSLAEEKVRQGELTEAEAAVHPHRHILTRALGVSSDVDVDLWELRLHAGDRILLCSDGLTNEVPDDRIAAVLTDVGDPGQAARELVSAALEHGGNDNVTVVVVDVVSDDEAPAATSPAMAQGTLPTGAETQVVGASNDVPTNAHADRSSAAHASAAATATLAPEVGEVEEERVEALPGAGPPVGPRRAPGGSAARRVRPSRREKRLARRRAGIPRLVTVRVVLFVVLVGAVVAAAYAVVRWYAMDEWYVTADHGKLAVYHGRPGGFLWIKPTLADRTNVTVGEIPAYDVTKVKGTVEQPSESSATRYIHNLHDAYLASQRLGLGQTPSSVTTTTAAPPTTTTTPPLPGTAAAG